MGDELNALVKSAGMLRPARIVQNTKKSLNRLKSSGRLVALTAKEQRALSLRMMRVALDYLEGKAMGV